MTEKEAIKTMKAAIAKVVNEAERGLISQIIDEWIFYHNIGTVEECQAAVAKQKPTKPDYEGDGYADGQLVYDTWICPNCGKRYEVDYDDYAYCPKCGQAIDQTKED